MSTNPTTVVVADDHPLYRAGLVDAIGEHPDLELVAECGGGRDAVEQILERRPQVALLDMRMRDLDGMAVLEELTRAGSRTRVVFLSAYEEGEVVHGALSAGAAGYLSKETDRTEICDAVVGAAGGNLVVSPSLPGVLVEYMHRRADTSKPRLGEREHEVMRLTAEGLSAPRDRRDARDRRDDRQDAPPAHLPQARRDGPRRDGRQGAAAGLLQ